MRYLLIITVLSFLSCKEKKGQTLQDKQKEIKTGSLDSTNSYTADEIGWAVTIPESWPVQPKKELEKLVEKNVKQYKEENNAQLNLSQLKQLINLFKDKSNFFFSTIHPFDTVKNGNYFSFVNESFDMLKEAYTANKIPVASNGDIVKIDGLDFSFMKIKIYNDDKSILMTQVIYNRLINGYDFQIIYSYNNEGNQADLENMVFSSKFSKR